MTSSCPFCGAATPSEGGHYCEQCGTDLRRAQPAPPITGPRWEVRVIADQKYFDRVEADEVSFPIGGTDRRFWLEKDRATIGRRSASRGIYPDIDLSGPPTDTGVSHLHAVLVRGAGDSWAIVDPGSTNGTYLNDSLDAIPTDELVPVTEGDRIHMGGWTTLTLHATAPGPESADEP
jgi:FHA domain